MVRWPGAGKAKVRSRCSGMNTLQRSPARYEESMATEPEDGIWKVFGYFTVCADSVYRAPRLGSVWESWLGMA